MILSIALLAACTKTDPQSSPYAPIAQCLTEKGVKFYGAYWCPHCADQKKLFGDAMAYVTYVECDAKGENGNPEACKAAGVNRYPTWAFPGQENITGVHTPEDLAKKANCEVTTATTATDTQGETQATQATTQTTTPPVEPLSPTGITPAVITPTAEVSPKATEPTPPAAVTPKEITVSSAGFSPSTLTVPVGTSVVFKNTEESQHWPASDPHPAHTIVPGFDAKKGLKNGETYSYTFDKVGTFSFHDHLNPGFKGSITVQ